MREDVDTPVETLTLLHRDMLERIILQWAADSGLIYEDDTDLQIDWLYSEVDVLKESQSLFLRLGRS